MASRGPLRRGSRRITNVSLSGNELELLDAYIARHPKPKPSRRDAVRQLILHFVPRAAGALYTDLNFEESARLPYGATYGDAGVGYINTDPRRQRNMTLFLNGLEKVGGCEDGNELLEIILVCGQHGLALPVWILKDLRQRLRRVYETRSWNDALGHPPKGSSLSKWERDKLLRPKIYSRIMAVRKGNPGRPIDDGLFEDIGREFGIGKTLCGQLFYAHSKQLKWLASGSLKDENQKVADWYAVAIQSNIMQIPSKTKKPL